MLEQFLRFFDFEQILPRNEIDEDWREHLGCGRRSALSGVKARKTKRAAQLDSLRLLPSSDFRGFIEGIFDVGNIRVARHNKNSPRTRCSSASSQCWPVCSAHPINSPKISSPVSSFPASAFAMATCIPQNGSQR
jgi:hypothetical protein